MTTAVCVIGAGPRGTSVLERLCANAPHGTPLVVHLVDPYPPGAGAVWRTAQSGELLMNTVAAQVSLYTDDSVPCAGPVVPGPSLYEWARTGSHPDEIAREVAVMGPDSYPTRRCYGHYLRAFFERVVRTAPEHVTIEVHRATAVGLADERDGRQTVTLAGGARLTGLDVVVLALGHGDVEPTADQERLRRFAATRRFRYVPPANPADVDLSGLRPGAPVALRGLGLCFFDYLALLTTGRGGRFDDDGGRLRYLPSGREPVLYAGSRRGVPYHARGENQKGAVRRHEPRFLTEARVAMLRRRPAVSFRRDVWPLIAREVQAVYYETLLGKLHGPAVASAFLADYAVCALGGAEEGALLDRFGLGPARRWDWERIAAPCGDRVFGDRVEFRSWLLGQLSHDLAEARAGNVGSPLKAALDVLRDIRNEVRLAVDHSGITGASYRDDLATWYTPLNAYLSIGPPPHRVAQARALVEANVLRLLGPGMRVRLSAHGFLVDAAQVRESPVVVEALVEARLPEVDLCRSTNTLLRRLLATGQCAPYRLGSYVTGGLAVTGRPYHLLDAMGRPHPRRFAFGVPTEYVHWVTAAGVRPGVGSVTLLDSDAIARAALGEALVDPVINVAETAKLTRST
ncbi:FAD/NAD(P)-binding protein [Actinophytocola sediminis]